MNQLEFYNFLFISQVIQMNTFFSCRSLTLDDWSLINNITNAYDTWGLDCDTSHINNYSLTDSSLTDFLNDEQQMYRSLIEFF